MLNRFTPAFIVGIGSIVLSILLSMSSIISMRNLEAMGIYDFMPADYLKRVVLLFVISAVFLSVNVFFDRLKLGRISLNLLKVKSVVLLNSFLFCFVIVFLLTIATNRTDAFYAEIGISEMKGRVMLATILPYLIIVVTSMLIGGSFRFMRENYLIGIKNEQLNKENAEAKLANLKEQLNPHFLFNSFSTLNELIDESPAKAKNFVHDMSDLYRYVLKHEQTDLVDLAEELEFAMNYKSMLKERFGDSFSCSFNVTSLNRGKKVLPMSVQMLIENAVKHNYFDHENPLHIFISTSEDHIKVSNPMKKRKVVESHGVGLYNLNQRYSLLTDQEVLIRKTERDFEVQIPLI